MGKLCHVVMSKCSHAAVTLLYISEKEFSLALSIHVFSISKDFHVLVLYAQ